MGFATDTVFALLPLSFTGGQPPEVAIEEGDIVPLPGGPVDHELDTEHLLLTGTVPAFSLTLPDTAAHTTFTIRQPRHGKSVQQTYIFNTPPGSATVWTYRDYHDPTGTVAQCTSTHPMVLEYIPGAKRWLVRKSAPLWEQQVVYEKTRAPLPGSDDVLDWEGQTPVLVITLTIPPGRYRLEYNGCIRAPGDHEVIFNLTDQVIEGSWEGKPYWQEAQFFSARVNDPPMAVHGTTIKEFDTETTVRLYGGRQGHNDTRMLGSDVTDLIDDPDYYMHIRATRLHSPQLKWLSPPHQQMMFRSFFAPQDASEDVSWTGETPVLFTQLTLPPGRFHVTYQGILRIQGNGWGVTMLSLQPIASMAGKPYLHESMCLWPDNVGSTYSPAGGALIELEEETTVYLYGVRGSTTTSDAIRYSFAAVVNNPNGYVEIRAVRLL